LAKRCTHIKICHPYIPCSPTYVLVCADAHGFGGVAKSDHDSSETCDSIDGATKPFL
jgi:hypothetical protein